MEKQYVVFGLGKEEYGIDIISVQEIIVPPKITEIPNSPPYMSGVTNLRGRIIPLIDLKKRFAIEGSEDTENTRVIVININNPVGLKVDYITEVIRIDNDAIEDCQDISTGIDGQFITGIAKHGEKLIILLELSTEL